MRCHRMFAAAALACVALASAARADALLLYEQTFTAGAAITDSGWTVDTPGGWYSGTYSGSFDPGGLRDAATDDPINGNTGVYIGVGGPVTNALGMYYTTEGLGGFEPIDPATCERLILSIFANTQAGGGDDHGYFALRLGDGDSRTDDDTWYISSSPMAAPTQNQGVLFNLRTLIYDPAPGNWNALTLATPAIGAPAGDLSGLIITGVGIVQSLTNPAPLPDFSNPEAFSSWNYSDYRIFCAPEPSALLLLAAAAPLAVALRRRTK